MSFCLKMKSDYSFLTSTITLADAISFCKQNKMTYASLVDSNLSGAINFYDLCLQNNLKPIIGVELKVLYHETFFPLVFISLNENGFKNISVLSSLASAYKKNYLLFEEIYQHCQDVAIIISSEDSYLTECFKEKDLTKAHTFINDLKRTNTLLYLGLYRYKNCNNDLLINLKEFVLKENIKVLAMQYATHKSEKDTIILNLLDCIAKNEAANKKFLNEPAILEAYLKNQEQLKIYYDKDELEELDKLAASINLKLPHIDFSLPLVTTNPNEKLKELAYDGLTKKNLLEPIYQQRVEYELQVITQRGFANYYLIVADYVNYAKNNHIPVGPARGSGAASLVAYLLNITTIDPLKYDLLFERFLNPYRSNYPDFDVDFSDTLRDEVIKYVQNKYGFHHVAYIATFATFGPKSAIRDLARILKISNDDVDSLMKTLPDNPLSINDEYKNNERFKAMLDIHANLKTLCSLASDIDGLKKQIGLHAAGLILSKDNLDELVPTFQVNENTLALQYDYANAEKIGLIKMDFLGLKNLSIIDYCLNKINQIEKTNYTIDNIEFDYPETYQLIANSYNLGIFQLESQGMNNVIFKLKPNCFDDIVAILALYRPGTKDMIDSYIARKNGQENYQIEPLIKDILKPTYGIILYQEQIMQICQKIANYSLGEADVLRRAISKKKASLLVNEKNHFLEGCQKNNISLEKANNIFDLILRFATYGFNKAHSVGYGKIVAIMAHLKVTHPAIFYEALLNVDSKNLIGRRKIFYEAKKLNINFLKPSVLNSSLDFKTVDNNLLFGLKNIATIKENIATIIINERNKAPYKDIYDFIIRMALNNISMEIILDLIYAGALDDFKIKRELLTANLNKLYDFAKMFLGLDYTPNTYDDQKYDFISKPLLLFEDQETDFYKKEYDMLGLYLADSPLQKIKNKLNKKITNLGEISNFGFYDILAKITLIEIRKTKDNKDYLSLNIEDDGQVINVKEYNKPEYYMSKFHKNDVVLVNVTFKNQRYYLNNMEKVEVDV